MDEASADPSDTLKRAREAAGLTQEAAARLLGVTGKTISRWETGAPVKPKDVSSALRTYQDHADPAGSLDKKVPRDTNGATGQANDGGLSRQLRILAAEFEVEALKLGAEEEEMAYVRQALQSPETARMFAYGYVDRAGLSEEALRLDYEGLIEGLRLYVKMRVKRRNEAKRRG
jgi:transcriptional regulator with XRE-family HTH domain